MNSISRREALQYIFGATAAAVTPGCLSTQEKSEPSSKAKPANSPAPKISPRQKALIEHEEKLSSILKAGKKDFDKAKNSNLKKVYELVKKMKEEGDEFISENASHKAENKGKQILNHIITSKDHLLVLSYDPRREDLNQRTRIYYASKDSQLEELDPQSFKVNSNRGATLEFTFRTKNQNLLQFVNANPYFIEDKNPYNISITNLMDGSHQQASMLLESTRAQDWQRD